MRPSAHEDLGQLIADSLHCELERAAPLAQLVHEKTAGNPFFAIQFISALAEEGLLTFDHGAARWSWDLKRIHAKGYTDNVVDLMVGKLSRLPVETQKALNSLPAWATAQSSPCWRWSTRNRRRTCTATCGKRSERGSSSARNDAYRFLHDRVQEAAYSLIPEDARAAAHLRIGRLLASRTAPAEIEEKIFEIVNQLNRGSHLDHVS